MTATTLSMRFSGSFVTLLIWAGSTTVVCIVDEMFGVQTTTTVGYNSTEMLIDGNTHGESIAFACGNNSHKCSELCSFCNSLHGAPTMKCLSQLLDYLCLKHYEHDMTSLNSTDWCIWGNVSGLYSNLSLCTEEISDCLLIPWPNLLVEQIFVDIHTKFFNDCPMEELSDPPPVIVFALVITPICLIPVMVSLVVFKTKNGDGSS